MEAGEDFGVLSAGSSEIGWPAEAYLVLFFLKASKDDIWKIDHQPWLRLSCRASSASRAHKYTIRHVWVAQALRNCEVNSRRSSILAERPLGSVGNGLNLGGSIGILVQWLGRDQDPPHFLRSRQSRLYHDLDRRSVLAMYVLLRVIVLLQLSLCSFSTITS